MLSPRPIIRRSARLAANTISTGIPFLGRICAAVAKGNALEDVNAGLANLPLGAAREDDGRWSPSLSPLTTAPPSPLTTAPPSPLTTAPPSPRILPQGPQAVSLSAVNTALSAARTPNDEGEGRPQKRPRSEKQKAKGKARSKARKAAQRSQRPGDASPRVGPHAPGAFGRRHPVPDTVEPPHVDLNTRAATNAYTGRQAAGIRRTPWTLEELKALGFRLIDWHPESGDADIAILGAGQTIIAGCFGPPKEHADRPSSKPFGAAVDEVGVLYEEGRREMEEEQGRSRPPDHRRGRFAALNDGGSFGTGQLFPQNLHHDAAEERLLERIRAHPSVRRLAGHQSSCLASWFPRPFVYLAETVLHPLKQNQPGVRMNFTNSVYPTATHNLGPATVALDHTDSSNAPDLPCGITAIGDFNPDYGGHLYLWEFRLVIRFPPGATIILSSACIRHGNVPIAEGEHRYSLTQYVPGGLARWVRLGFRKCTDLTAGERAAMDGGPEARAAEILSRYSTTTSLQADRRELVERMKQWEENGLWNDLYADT